MMTKILSKHPPSTLFYNPMALLGRPSVAALSMWRSHFFCSHHRTFIFPQSPRLPASPSAPHNILSNGKLPFLPAGVGDLPRRNFCARAATGVGDSGAVDSNLIQSMEKKIKEGLTAESVIVTDAYGDGRHVSIDVISTAFEGQSAVNRQRMVYKAIWEELQNTVHAVDQMTTRTPTEAKAAAAAGK